MDVKPELLDKIKNYRVPKTAKALIQQTKIVFLVGITAAGKDTIISELLKSGDYHYTISHTTREPRYNHGILEQDGIDYHFVDDAAIERMLDNHEFVEAKLVHGKIYGTSIAEIQIAHDRSEIAINEVEVQGVAEYRAVSNAVLPIFLLPPNFAVWQERLLKRYGGNVDQNDLFTRMQTAVVELEDALAKDYFEFVINVDLNQAIQAVDAIAHGNISVQKNNAAKTIACELLADIRRHLESTESSQT